MPPRTWASRVDSAPVGRTAARWLRRRRAGRALEALADGPRDPAKPALLVANHYFHQEIRALEASKAFSDRFQLVRLDPWTFFGEVYACFPYAVRSGGLPYDEPRLRRGRARARRHAEWLLDRLQARYPVRALVTPSDIFFWLREFIAVARDRGLPTFVYDKEGTISPGGFDTEPGRTNRLFPPVADWFYVWSERQRRFWTLAGFPPERIRVLGSLRTDLFVNLDPPAQRGVLFFDFEDEAYLNPLTPAERAAHPGTWAPMRQEIHELLLDAARRHPGVRFTFKLHPQQADRDATLARLNGLGLPNVQARADPQGVPDLVASHSIAFGFQTTALMEVALTDRPSVYCAWGPLHESLRPRLVPLMEPGFGIHWVRSADDMRRWIERHLGAGWKPRRPDAARLATFFHRADGRVADRYADAMATDLGLAAEVPRQSAPARARRARRRPR